MIKIPQRIAHRGLSAVAPENTLDAFVLAEKAGYQMFECDVQLSKDGVPVIFHDETLERTTAGHGRLQDHNFKELQALGINSLAEVLEWLIHHSINMDMNLELKGQQTELMNKVAKMLKPLLPQLKERILVSSFEWEQLAKFKALGFGLPISVLVDRHLFRKHGFGGIRDCFNSLGAVSLNVDVTLLNDKTLPQFLAICPKILVYTVQPDQIESLVKKGVSGAFTNG